eukprot:scaffold644_cov353-Prasinococcus_capsulatus_cf.AAC.4
MESRPRWDLNPQSPAPEADALSIRPRGPDPPLSLAFPRREFAVGAPAGDNVLFPLIFADWPRHASPRARGPAAASRSAAAAATCVCFGVGWDDSQRRALPRAAPPSAPARARPGLRAPAAYL